ncbi:MAG: hypothetical protein I4N50_17125, partial [Rhizobium sp.]|nr:hypothetical protein [Rhizobium sp.]
MRVDCLDTLSEINELQIQQLDYLDFRTERKRWEAAKARQAPPEDDDMIEEPVEDAPLPHWTNFAPQSAQEMAEADYVAAQEEYELQQLIASMEQDDAASQHFGSDDEDYEELFMECATTVDQQYQQQPQQYQQQPQQLRPMAEETDTMDMDMTDG